MLGDHCSREWADEVYYICYSLTFKGWVLSHVSCAPKASSTFWS